MVTILVGFIGFVLALLVIGYMPLTVLAGIISLVLMYISEQPATSAPAEVVGVVCLVLMILAIIFDNAWRKKRVAHDRQQRLYRRAQKELELEAIKAQIRSRQA